MSFCEDICSHSLGYLSRSGTAGLYGNTTCLFLGHVYSCIFLGGTPHCYPKWLPFYILHSHQQCWGSNFSTSCQHSLPTFIFYLDCEVVSHCGLVCISPAANENKHLSCACHLCIFFFFFFEKCLFKFFDHFKFRFLEL